jgi:hypothetical protein
MRKDNLKNRCDISSSEIDKIYRKKIILKVEIRGKCRLIKIHHNATPSGSTSKYWIKILFYVYLCLSNDDEKFSAMSFRKINNFFNNN